MRYRNLLTAFLLSAILGATANEASAQQDTINPQNNTVMNRYTYMPENYQRGSSTSEVKIFPNPARSQATLYINSIKEEDRGEVMVYDNTGKVVLHTTVAPGNNTLNVGNFSTGMYMVKIVTKDRAIYTQPLVVTK